MDPLILPCADCGLLTGQFCDGGKRELRDSTVPVIGGLPCLAVDRVGRVAGLTVAMASWSARRNSFVKPEELDASNHEVKTENTATNICTIAGVSMEFLWNS